MGSETVYSIKEAANLIGISTSYVHKLATANELAYGETIDRGRAVTKKSVDLYIARRDEFFARHWTTNQVAAKLGISRTAVDHLVIRGQLTPARLGGRIGFVPADVITYANSRGLSLAAELGTQLT